MVPRLLIVTQAVDSRHTNLGFFVRWIAEFAKHVDVVVIANEVGEYQLPSNVEVHSLGKEKGVGRLGRYINFYTLIFRLRYTAVLCHMNPEFVIAGGWWWRLSGRPIVLWYMHKSVTARLRLAERLVRAVATASAESFRLPSSKVHILGHGIDTDIFTPDPSVSRGTHALSVGRLMPSKRHDKAIDMAQADGRPLYIAGEGPERAALEAYAKTKGAAVTFLGGVMHGALLNEYRQAAYLIHTSETGSLDKVVLEAMACDTPVVSTSEAFRSVPLTAGGAYVQEHHSLQQLIPRILTLYNTAGKR